MKLTSKIVTVVAASMMIAQVVCPTEQKIVAYKAKGMNLGQNSAIQIWQNGQKVSAATFSTATNKKGNSLTPTSFFPKGKKTLFFTQGTDVGIDYNYFGVDDAPGEFPAGSSVGPNQRTSSYKTFPASKIPVGSKIKVSIGTGGSSQRHPFNIEIEPRFVRVNVKKTDAATHGKKWKIYALKESVLGAQFYPNKNEDKEKIYDSVNIAKDTTTSKLNVPTGLNFWILVPKNSGPDVKIDKVTPMAAKEVTTSSVINISADGTATWAN